MTTPRKPKRAVLYGRVSTDRGEQDPESQLVAERIWAAGRDLVVVAEFTDRITSDPKRRRRDPPGLTQALHMIENGEADVLVIFAADRLVADPLRLLQLVTRVQDAGGTITSVQDGRDLDTTNELGELSVFMMGWFNRWRLKLCRAHSIRGQQKARAEGREPGRRRKLTRAQVLEVQELLRQRGADAGCRSVADHLNEGRPKNEQLSHMAVKRALALESAVTKTPLPKDPALPSEPEPKKEP